MDLQRLDLGNALYYVELKSNGHRPLFAERAGFSTFLELLSGLQNETGASTLAYCLLQDSIHLVIHNGEQSLQNSCNHLIKHYTQYAQQQWKHNGSLFHKHPHSLLLEPSRYLLPLVQQLHQRPVEMGLVAEASIYPWSSLQSYLGENPQQWIDTQAFEQHTGLCGRRRQTHLECLSQPPAQPLNLHLGNHHQVWALASNAFINSIRQRNESSELSCPDIHWLLQQTCTNHRVCVDDLKLRHGYRRHHELKAEVLALALEFENPIREDISPDEGEAESPEHRLPALDSLNISPNLEAQLKAVFDCSIDTLTASVITLQQTRGDYLYARYLQLRQIWQADQESQSSADPAKIESVDLPEEEALDSSPQSDVAVSDNQN